MTCPNCGYCPACGRARTYPYTYPVYPNPWWNTSYGSTYSPSGTLNDISHINISWNHAQDDDDPESVIA